MSEELLAQIRPGMDLLNRRDSSRLTCRPDGALSGRAASAPG